MVAPATLFAGLAKVCWLFTNNNKIRRLQLEDTETQNIVLLHSSYVEWQCKGVSCKLRPPDLREKRWADKNYFLIPREGNRWPSRKFKGSRYMLSVYCIWHVLVFSGQTSAKSKKTIENRNAPYPSNTIKKKIVPCGYQTFLVFLMWYVVLHCKYGLEIPSL